MVPGERQPRDKATFDFSITVPAGLTAMANGVLVSNTTAGGRTSWVWRETDPMAPYLATATLGRFDLTISATSAGVPTYVAVDPQLPKGQVLDAVDFCTSIHGPYPFNAVRAIVDRAKVVGCSLETQTKPVFDRMPSEATLVHELSHMRYGDSVTLTTWPDIWLHEGFATWSEWIWSEHQGNKSAAQWCNELLNTPAQDTGFGTPPPGDPGTPVFLFNGTIYNRGAPSRRCGRRRSHSTRSPGAPRSFRRDRPDSTMAAASGQCRGARRRMLDASSSSVRAYDVSPVRGMGRLHKREGNIVSEKPSYIGLLNAISLAESDAECYLNAWAAATTDDGVRSVLSTVALREGEHGKAFAKRLCELGYAVQPRESDAAAKLEIASSTTLSDREKFEKLNVGRGVADRAPDNDVFLNMFRDTTLDIQTSALLGRYVAEERDSGRMLAACYTELCRRENGGHGATASPDIDERLSRVEALLEKICETLSTRD